MKNIKYLLVFISGILLAIGISNAYKLNANDVTYDKKTTTLESNTVSGAIDELGVLATTSMSEVKAKLDSIESLLMGSSGTSDINMFNMVKSLYDSSIKLPSDVVAEVKTSTSNAYTTKLSVTPSTSGYAIIVSSHNCQSTNSSTSTTISGVDGLVSYYSYTSSRPALKVDFGYVTAGKEVSWNTNAAVAEAVIAVIILKPV